VQLSAVQFHLITTTILFLSREGFRRGGLRIQEQSGKVGGGQLAAALRDTGGSTSGSTGG
jgi:oligosaccharide translocation protein RFT1